MDRLAAAVAICGSLTTGGFTLLGVTLNQRFHERERAREHAAAAEAKVDEAVQELFDAVSALRLALAESVPLWNSWRPRLMLLGASYLEFAAGQRAAGVEQGMAQAGRLAVGYGDREVAALLARFRGPVERVSAVMSRAARLPAADVRSAALHLADAAAAAAQAYGRDNLWRPKVAKAARDQADDGLASAMQDLLDALDQQPSAAPSAQPAPWWRRSFRRLRLGPRRPAALAAGRD